MKEKGEGELQKKSWAIDALDFNNFTTSDEMEFEQTIKRMIVWQV